MGGVVVVGVIVVGVVVDEPEPVVPPLLRPRWVRLMPVWEDDVPVVGSMFAPPELYVEPVCAPCPVAPGVIVGDIVEGEVGLVAPVALGLPGAMPPGAP